MNAGRAPNDLRGPLRRIGRLVGFYPVAYFHVIIYRIMVPLALVCCAVIAAYLFVPGLGALLKIFVAVLWAMWTLQLFRVFKGLALAWSRGMAFGNLNEEFAHLYRMRYKPRAGIYRALPFAFLVVWVCGFAALLVWWRP
jgi:hypothetical protein